MISNDKLAMLTEQAATHQISSQELHDLSSQLHEISATAQVDLILKRHHVLAEIAARQKAHEVMVMELHVWQDYEIPQGIYNSVEIKPEWLKSIAKQVYLRMLHAGWCPEIVCLSDTRAGIKSQKNNHTFAIVRRW